MKLEVKKYTWIDGIRIPYKCSPVATIIRIIIVLFARMIPTIQIFVTAMFINKALAFVNGTITWKPLIVPILLLAVLIICERLSSVFTNISNQNIGNGLRMKYVTALTTKCAMLNYVDIENDTTWDLIKRVKNKSDEVMQRGMESEISLLGIGIQIVGFLGVLLFQMWWLVFLILVLTIPVIWIGMKGGEEQYQAQKEVTKYERRYEYLEEILTNREAVDERSLFGFSEKFQENWKKYYMKARQREVKITAKWLFRMKAISSTMIIFTFAIAFVLLYQVSKGNLSVGLFISLVQAASNLVGLMSWDLSDHINDFSKFKGYIKDLSDFACLPEVSEAIQLPTKSSIDLKNIEFKNVTFSYPGTTKKVLNQFNLKIEKGHHYSIVGGNGAGKTTIIKLLTGLYTDFQGDILINGISIREFPLSELKGLMTVLFQDFSCYSISVHDNIGLGNVGNIGSIEQDQQIMKVAQQFGLKSVVDNFKEGMHTQLGKLMKDGQDLSGGEWQRVAMARAILSTSQLLILDEPTAALDPRNESLLYKEFEKISRGRTTLLISHRLGSTKLADEIIVLHQGQVVQQGNHDMLMNQCSLYRKMYESQRSWYQ